MHSLNEIEICGIIEENNSSITLHPVIKIYYREGEDSDLKVLNFDMRKKLTDKNIIKQLRKDHNRPDKKILFNKAIRKKLKI